MSQTLFSGSLLVVLNNVVSGKQSIKELDDSLGGQLRESILPYASLGSYDLMFLRAADMSDVEMMDSLIAILPESERLKFIHLAYMRCPNKDLIRDRYMSQYSDEEIDFVLLLSSTLGDESRFDRNLQLMDMLQTEDDIAFVVSCMVRIPNIDLRLTDKIEPIDLLFSICENVSVGSYLTIWNRAMARNPELYDKYEDLLHTVASHDNSSGDLTMSLMAKFKTDGMYVMLKNNIFTEYLLVQRYDLFKHICNNKLTLERNKNETVVALGDVLVELLRDVSSVSTHMKVTFHNAIENGITTMKHIHSMLKCDSEEVTYILGSYYDEFSFEVDEKTYKNMNSYSLEMNLTDPTTIFERFVSIMADTKYGGLGYVSENNVIDSDVLTDVLCDLELSSMELCLE